MSKLTFCGCDQYDNEGDAVTIDTAMTEADFSGKKLGTAGALILAAFMSTKLFEAKGALSELDLSKNDLGSAGLSAVSEALKSTSIRQLNIAESNLMYKCNGYYDVQNGTYDASGLTALAKSIGNLKELNISNNRLRAEEAKVLVPALEANGSLASLNLAGNHLFEEGAKHIAKVLPKW